MATPIYLTTSQAAARLGVSIRSICLYCQQGRLGAKFGQRGYLITEPELANFQRVPIGHPFKKSTSTSEIKTYASANGRKAKLCNRKKRSGK